MERKTLSSCHDCEIDCTVKTFTLLAYISHHSCNFLFSYSLPDVRIDFIHQQDYKLFWTFRMHQGLFLVT